MIGRRTSPDAFRQIISGNGPDVLLVVDGRVRTPVLESFRGETTPVGWKRIARFPSGQDAIRVFRAELTR